MEREPLCVDVHDDWSVERGELGEVHDGDGLDCGGRVSGQRIERRIAAFEYVFIVSTKSVALVVFRLDDELDSALAEDGEVHGFPFLDFVRGAA